jgi:hypothetical protein
MLKVHSSKLPRWWSFLCLIFPAVAFLNSNKQLHSRSLSFFLKMVSIDRSTSRRWNGNYKSTATDLSKISKAKKMEIPLTANGVTKVLQKRRMESIQHVLTKAVLWKVFMDDYPDLQIERDIGDPNYLPDIVQLDSSGKMPIFWGEAGRVKPHKAIDLMQRYPDTHIVHCRWGMDIDQFRTPVLETIEAMQEEGTLMSMPERSQPFEFCSIPFDVWKFVDEDTMTLHVCKDDLLWDRTFYQTYSH